MSLKILNASSITIKEMFDLFSITFEMKDIIFL